MNYHLLGFFLGMTANSTPTAAITMLEEKEEKRKTGMILFLLTEAMIAVNSLP